MFVLSSISTISSSSKDMESHQQHVWKVLHHIWQYQLFSKPEKCEFHLDSVEYLGYHLSPEGLTMSPDKIQTILDWPESCKVKDIQSFLVFANFYHCFIFNYSNIMVPLTWLTWKDAPWNFSEDCWCSFNVLKHTFTTAPILTHFIPDTPITVETNASDYAVTGILSITCVNREIHLVAYYSWTLTALELNYNTHNKELLTIFKTFWTWHHYLEGSASPIDVIMDHKNLEYFSTSKVLSCWQAQWSEFLSQFNLVIHFHPGKLREKPDALTRQWDVYPKKGDSGYACVNPYNLWPVFTHEQLSNSLCATYLESLVLHAVTIMDVETLHDDILSTLPSDPVAQIHLSDPLDSCWSTDESGFLCLDNQIYVPDCEDLHLHVLQFKHDHPLSGHFGQNRTLKTHQMWIYLARTSNLCKGLLCSVMYHLH